MSISNIKGWDKYQITVNAINDFIHICPNCYLVIHIKEPA